MRTIYKIAFAFVLVVAFNSAIFGAQVLVTTMPDGDRTKVAGNVFSAVSELSVALQKLKNHNSGTTVLNATEIKTHYTTIKNNVSLLGSADSIILQAFEVVRSYDKYKGAIFINSSTKQGFTRATITGFELEQAMFELQQGLIDYAYTSANLKRNPAIFKDFKFESSTYFPGAVAAPADSTITKTVKINASVPKDWGSPVLYATNAARRPTGCYLAPGTVAIVKVPLALVNKGFKVRVGAHSWDLIAKTTVKRFDRVSLVFSITDTITAVSNPLGGGIYIEVPYLANYGLMDVEIKNAVESPFFSARSFDKTPLENWRSIERKKLGPWADFESDKFMMQVPTSWIYNYDNPVTLMNDWDKGMDAVSELFGLPLVRNRTVLYLQIDVMYRGTANFPGYPQSNYPYTPTAAETGNKNHFTLKGPQTSDYTVFHELGHAQSFTKFTGETEAVVNFLFVAMQNRKFNMELNKAFSLSLVSNTQISIPQVALTWMVTPNFRKDKAMDNSGSTKDEMKYQHRGFGKYAEIVNLFGWDALINFWKSVHEDYEKGITYPTNTDPTDNRILRLSKNAGVDLTPLIHFWGIQPVNGANLKSTIATAGLKPSVEIYDRLIYYKSIIPLNNQQFQTHAHVIYPGTIGTGESPYYGEGFYNVWLSVYGTAQGDSAVTAMQKIIDRYFPDGRPAAPNALTTINSKQKVEYYPNPAGDFIYLDEMEKPYNVEISDLTGKVLLKFMNYADRKINIHVLKKGSYIVRIFDDRTIKSGVLLKKYN
jgi:hypothetical protein